MPYPCPVTPPTAEIPQSGRREPGDPGPCTDEKGRETPDGDGDGSEPRGTRGRIGAPDHGGPGRAAARDADDARHRGARDDAVPPGQGPRLVLRRVRPRGRVRR